MADHLPHQLDQVKLVTEALEQKLALAAKLMDKPGHVNNEPSLHADNIFLRAENEALRQKIREHDDLVNLVRRQSEMVRYLL